MTVNNLAICFIDLLFGYSFIHCISRSNTFIVESFSDEDVDITVQCQTEGALKDLLSGEDVNGSRVMSWGRSTSNEKSFRVHLKPHSYRVFKF